MKGDKEIGERYRQWSCVSSFFLVSVDMEDLADNTVVELAGIRPWATSCRIQFFGCKMTCGVCDITPDTPCFHGLLCTQSEDWCCRIRQDVVSYELLHLRRRFMVLPKILETMRLFQNWIQALICSPQSRQGISGKISATADEEEVDIRQWKSTADLVPCNGLQMSGGSGRSWIQPLRKEARRVLEDQL